MKVSYSLFAILLLAFIGGCKQDFDITSDYKETPVVYGLLSQQDNTHYIRIQKGYLIDGNALVAAGVTDSIYYQDVLTVKLLQFNTNGTSGGADIPLSRVDGNNVNQPKDPSGPFASTPNWLYQFSAPLDQDKSYRLQVTNTSNGYSFNSIKDEDNHDVTLVKDFQVIAPYKAGDKISLQNAPSAYSIKWRDAENAGVYDLTIRFFYTEYRLSDGSFYKNDSIDIPLFKSIMQEYVSNHMNTMELTSDAFLHFLAANIKSDVDVVREFNTQKGMQFKFAAGGTELAKFMNSQRAQSGLASNEALPPYSNIAGGVGLLSSRYFKEVDGVLLSNNALDSLACSDISRALRFKNHSGAICQ